MMRIAWVCVLCALLSLVIAQDSSEDQILLDECYAGVFNRYCATISTSNCGQTLDGVYTVDGTLVDTDSKNISAIIGAQSGMEKLICQSTMGGACQGCWSVNNVTFVDDNQLQTCFSFTVACSGAFSAHNNVNFGCSVITCEAAPTGCRDGFYGPDCQISVQDGCISDPTQDPPVNVCVELPELSSPVCNLVANLASVVNSTENSNSETWTMSLATSRTIDAALIYQTETLVPNCPAKFGYHPITVSEERVYGILYAMLTCVGDGAVYPLLDFSLDIPVGCSDSCGYSSDDGSIIPQEDYTIEADQWKYLRLTQAENTPIADLRLILTTNGTLSAVEKWDCRPSVDFNDHAITVTGESNVWTLVDSCDTARTQLSGSFYFGFHCDSPEGCDLSYEVIVHSIELVYLASQSSTKPILRADSYQYFQVVAGTDPFDINVYIQSYLGTTVSAGVYLQDFLAHGCASSENDFASTTSPVSTSSDDTFDFTLYTIHVSPVKESLIGRRISIRVDIHSDCVSQSCGFFHLELPFADDPVSYDTQPVTDGTVPVTDGTVPVTDGTVPVTGATELTTDLSTAVSDATAVSTNPDEDDGSSNYLYYLLFLILAVVGLVCILLIVAVIVAVVVFRIRKRKNTSANFDPTFEGEDAFDSL